jgi:hypothetical protein
VEILRLAAIAEQEQAAREEEERQQRLAIERGAAETAARLFHESRERPRPRYLKYLPNVNRLYHI